MLRRPIPDPFAELISSRLRVLGQPLRIKLIDHLERNPNATVHELTQLVEATQQNVSQHLVILHQAGILARHKDGTHVR
jgi:DNA-binding transcriptional ArsR family regulator